MDYMLPARIVRDRLFFHIAEVRLDKDGYLLGLLDGIHLMTLSHVRNLEKYIDIQKDVLITKMWIFRSALGLLAFGELSVIEEVLDNLPFAQQYDMEQTLSLLNIVDILLPLPQNLRGNPDTGSIWVEKLDEFRSWVKTNRIWLKWSEHYGRFILNDPETVKKLRIYRQYWIKGYEHSHLLIEHNKEEYHIVDVKPNSLELISIEDSDIELEVITRMLFSRRRVIRLSEKLFAFDNWETYRNLLENNYWVIIKINAKPQNDKYLIYDQKEGTIVNLKNSMKEKLIHFMLSNDSEIRTTIPTIIV